MSTALPSNYRFNSSPTYEYATAEDFQTLFASDMVDYFRLAFLLTADARKAEHCIITTMHECMANRSVFKEWLPVWTRNAVIRNAIRLVAGVQGHSLGTVRRREPTINKARQSAVGASDDSAGILELSDDDRLIYVLCVIERYSIRDCASLLGRSRKEVSDAHNRALAEIAAFEDQCRCSNNPSSSACSQSEDDRSESDDLRGSLVN